MNHKYILIVLLFFCPGPAMSLSTDKDKPMTIEADSVENDDRTGLTIYRGNVDVKQGTMKVTGDALVIERKDGKTNTVTVTGKPATYRQRPDNKRQDVTAEAHKLQFYPQRNLIKLERSAKIKQEDSLFTGNIIEYDNKNDSIRAQGNIGSTDTGTESRDRVRMTIQPEQFN